MKYPWNFDSSLVAKSLVHRKNLQQFAQSGSWFTGYWRISCLTEKENVSWTDADLRSFTCSLRSTVNIKSFQPVALILQGIGKITWPDSTYYGILLDSRFYWTLWLLSLERPPRFSWCSKKLLEFLWNIISGHSFQPVSLDLHLSGRLLVDERNFWASIGDLRGSTWIFFLWKTIIGQSLRSREDFLLNNSNRTVCYYSF